MNRIAVDPKTKEVQVQWPDGATNAPSIWWTYAKALAFVSREGASYA